MINLDNELSQDHEGVFSDKIVKKQKKKRMIKKTTPCQVWYEFLFCHPDSK